MVTERILVVDDEEPILFALSQFFEARGYAVDCARELEEAQALIAHVPYACVITDLRLTCSHGAEGLELVSFVRRSCAATRVVVLTAYGSPAVEQSTRARGGDAFLQKPIALPVLADIVSRLVSSSC